MHVFITGASGLIGKQLAQSLRGAGHHVTEITRRAPANDQQRQWEPAATALPDTLLDGCDVLVHLAGESIAEGRWNAAKKQRIRDSRVQSTRLLAEAIARREQKPSAFVVASAIGFYGDRGAEELTEGSPAGTGFLADVCREWEEAAQPAQAAGVRTVHVRTGIVLAKEGGALKAMLTPFRLGGGGIMGNGRQYWSWISLEDIVRMFEFAVTHDNVSGILNGTAPQPVTNQQFTKALGKALSRPTIFPMPAFAAKLVLGEMAEALILSSARVLPQQAEQFGFKFSHPELPAALAALKL